ncbi:MAG: CHAD domain-containing protein [Caldilineaceae bacterium]|nr:CHAD domain-containing protein [Caldilineaceae bacterium]MXZ20431.1 CHAD domain-containing protein [Caldilineaceae bacterium SB0665_bin_25]
MNFTLIPEEAPSDSLRRIAAEQIEGAIAQLQRKDDLNEGIHEARKHFKRVRALLRLARGALPAEIYVSENRFFRDLGRQLSPVRDSAVYIETLDLIRNRYHAQLADEPFLRLRERMVSEHRAVLNEFTRDVQRQESLFHTLQGAQPRANDWKFCEGEFSLFRGGLRRIYGRGRSEKAAAFAQPSTERFHAWRKRVKYLWHHLQLLQPLWPAQIKVLVRDCDRLADRLGEEHDLAVLLETPVVQAMKDTDGQSTGQLLTVVSRERERLRRAAIPLAQRIYVESAGRFVDRIEGYWLAYRPHTHFLPQGTTGRGER